MRSFARQGRPWPVRRRSPGACLAACAVVVTLALTLGAAAPAATTGAGPSSRASAAALLASRDAFRNESASQALTTARQKFSEFLDTPPLKWPALSSTERIDGYLNDHRALVAAGPGRRGLVESTTPLRGKTADGSEASIDLGLVDAGSTAFAPKSSAAAIRIPKDARDELRFPDQSFGVRLDGAPQQTAAINSNKAFFANVAQDSDLLYEPHPLGAELSVVLRSPSAPTAIPLRFSLSGDQKLKLADPTASAPLPPGSAEIVDGTKRVAVVYPPLAVDAQGQSVPVSYRLDGDRLVMQVDTSGDPALYPILVDPTIGVYDNNGTSAGSGTPGYTWPGWDQMTYADPIGAANTQWGGCAANTAGKKFYFCQGSLTGTLTGGGALFIKANAGLTYTDGDWAQWVKQAPDNAYIYRFDTTRLNNAGAFQARLAVGVRKADGTDWDWGSVMWGDGTKSRGDVTPTNAAAYRTPDGTALVDSTRYIYVHSDDWTTRLTPADPITPANKAAIRMRMDAGAPGSPLPYVQMGGAATYETDAIAPTLTASHSNCSSNPCPWTSSYTDTVSAAATDYGLGMGEIEASGPNLSANPTACATPQSGNAQNRYDDCSLTLGLGNTTYTAPPGVSTYTVTATDLVGNHSGAQDKTWTVKVDNTPPALTLSGTLFADNGQFLAPGSYALHTSATDGYSGVASTSIKVDNGTPSVVSQSCTSAGCPGSQARDWTFDTSTVSPGTHTITVTTTDQVGRSSTQTITVSTDRHSPTVSSVSHDHDLSAWVGSTTLTSTISAQDGSGESGVKQIGLSAPGDSQSYTANTSCDGIVALCPQAASHAFAYSTALWPTDGVQTVSATTTDGAGNISTPTTWQVKLDRAGPSGSLDPIPQYVSGTTLVSGTMTDALSGSQDWKLQVRRSGQTTWQDACGRQTSTTASYSCSWNTAATGFGDGTYDLRAEMRDNVPTANGGPNVSYTPVVTVQVESSAPTLTLSGTLFAHNGQVLAPGSYALHTSATDANSGVASTSIKVDNGTPSVASQSCTSAGCPGSQARDWTFDTSTVSSGTHTITVTATDQVGRSSTQTISVKTDGVAPAITSVTHQGLASWVGSKTISSTVNAHDGESGLSKIDVTTPAQSLTQSFGCDGYATPCPADGGRTFSYSTQSFPEGPNTVRATTTDAGGNGSAASTWQVNVDRSAPVGALVGVGQYSSGTPVITGTMTDALSGPLDWQLQFRQAGASVWQNACSAQPANLAGTYGCVWNTAALGDGSYELRAQMRDKVTVADGGPNVSYTPAFTTFVDNTPPDELTDIAPAVGSQEYSADLTDSDPTEASFTQHDGGSGVAQTTLEYNTATDGTANGDWVDADAPAATGDGNVSVYWSTSEMDPGLHLVRATTCDRAGKCRSTSYQLNRTVTHRGCSTNAVPGERACFAGYAYGVPGYAPPRDTQGPPCTTTLPASSNDDSSLVSAFHNLNSGGVLCLASGATYGDNQGTFYINHDNVTVETTPGQSFAEIHGHLVITGDNVTVREVRLNGQNLLDRTCDDNGVCEGCPWEPSGVTHCPMFSPSINGDNDRLIDNDITSRPSNQHYSLTDFGDDAVSTHNNCINIRPYDDSSPVPDGTLIKDNRIHDCGLPTRWVEDGHARNLSNDVSPAGGHWHGIYVGDATDTQITNNLIYRNGDRGIQLWPTAIRTRVEHNTIWDNGEGINLGKHSRDNTIVNNVIGQSRAGTDTDFYSYQWGGSRGYEYTSANQNNPIYNIYVSPDGIDDGPSNHIYNNCLWQSYDNGTSRGVGANAPLDLKRQVGYLDPDINYQPKSDDMTIADFRATSPGCRAYGANPTGYHSAYGVRSTIKYGSRPTTAGWTQAVGASLEGATQPKVTAGITDGFPCSGHIKPNKWTAFYRYTTAATNVTTKVCVKDFEPSGATKSFSAYISRDGNGRTITRVHVPGVGSMTVPHSATSARVPARPVLTEVFGRTNVKGRDLAGEFSSVQYATQVDPGRSDWHDGDQAHASSITSKGAKYRTAANGPDIFTDFCVFGPGQATEGCP